MGYAEDTEVAPEKSVADIGRTVKNAGGKNFVVGEVEDVDGTKNFIQFTFNGWNFRMMIPTPSMTDDEIVYTDVRRLKRDLAGRTKALEQEERRRWRVLYLVVKAKFESIDSGLESVEKAFLSYVVLPDQSLLGDAIVPVVTKAYLDGKMPSSLLGLPAPKNGS